MTQAVVLAQQASTGVSPGFRNRIINGGMTIDQRNAGASVTPANNAYTLDRWVVGAQQASKFSVQQDAGAVTPPVGFTDYLGCTSLSAYSVLSTDFFEVDQIIEGYNIADLGWGTANAKTITISFWVRSSLTGSFGGNILNNGETRCYPFIYTISAANTWEQKSITIAGDTSGTWTTTNNVGLRLCFSLGAGSAYAGPANAWSGNGYHGTQGTVSVVGTNGATFYITGVQLEVGSTATSFDYRPYGTELALCQRYFYQLNNQMQFGIATSYVSGINFLIYQNPVQMRTAPSITNNSASGTIATNGSTPSWNTVTLDSYSSVDTLPLTFNGTSTGGYAYSVRMTSGSISVSAEL